MLDNVFPKIFSFKQSTYKRNGWTKVFFFLFPYEQTTITMLFEQGCISQQSNRTKVERQTVCTGFWFSSFSVQSVNIWRRPNDMESQRVSRPPFPVQWSRVASHSASRQTLSNSADKWVSFGQRGGTSSRPEESAGYKTHSATIGERENLFSSSSFFYPASSFISFLFYFFFLLSSSIPSPEGFLNHLLEWRFVLCTKTSVAAVSFRRTIIYFPSRPSRCADFHL